jgi:hypothetical protein
VTPVFSVPLIASLLIPSIAEPLERQRAIAHSEPRVDLAADSPASKVVHVKVYDQSHLSQETIASILEIASRIWRPYGVAVDQDASADAVAIVISPHLDPEDHRGATLGTTLFSNGHATPYIRLWMGAAEAVADAEVAGGNRFRLRPREEREAILLRMMGVALAHELGHYLLDTKHHSPGGLLQTTLSIRDLQNPETAHLTLTLEQQRLLCLEGTLFRR